VFRADDLPDAPTDAAGTFGALLALAPLEGRGLSDELVARRRALWQLGPGFFRCYIEIVGGRRTGG
jgi:hypothetical protein